MRFEVQRKDESGEVGSVRARQSTREEGEGGKGREVGEREACDGESEEGNFPSSPLRLQGHSTDFLASSCYPCPMRIRGKATIYHARLENTSKIQEIEWKIHKERETERDKE